MIADNESRCTAEHIGGALFVINEKERYIPIIYEF